MAGAKAGTMRPTPAKALDAVFRAYDIRGDAHDGLCCGTVIAIARAYGDFISPEGACSFVIGHDARVTSRSLAEAVSLGLRSGGHQVTHIGLCTTPMLYWCGAAHGFDGSVMVTAGHAPPEYNGLKLCRAGAVSLTAEDGLGQLRARVRLPFVFDRACTPMLHRMRPLREYAAALRGFVEAHRPVKVAVDAGNGPGGIVTHEVFSHIPHMQIREIAFDPDGTFPSRSPDPSAPHALDVLAREVVRHGYEFGVAFDGDADRVIVVDERGDRVPSDIIGSLIARSLLRRHPGATILYGSGSSRAVPEIVAEAGGRASRTSSDGPLVKAALREQDALFAFVRGGRYFYADLYGTDSALRTLIELVNLVALSRPPLSELARDARRYVRAPQISVPVVDGAAAVEALAGVFADGDIDRVEGITVDYPDWSFNARAARTEAVLRLNVEARDAQRLDAGRAQLLGALHPFVSGGARP